MLTALTKDMDCTAGFFYTPRLPPKKRKKRKRWLAQILLAMHNCISKKAVWKNVRKRVLPHKCTLIYSLRLQSGTNKNNSKKQKNTSLIAKEFSMHD